MEIALLDNTERAVARSAWIAHEATIPERHLVSSWNWIEPWLEEFGDIVPHWFATGRDADGVRAMALLTEATERRGPISVRSVHLGTAGEPDSEGVYPCFNAVLAAPRQLPTFARLLGQRLAREHRWDRIVLDRLAPEAAEAFGEAMPRMATTIELAPAVDLHAANDNGGDVLATLRARTRQQIRRSLRELGPVKTEVAEDAAAARSILQELIALHQKRWRAKGAAGAFASGRFTAFHCELIERLLPHHAVILFRVRSSSGTVGCIYNLRDGDRVLSYLQGFAPFANGKVKPGFVSHALCMQECFARGYAEYNLLPGPSPYKLELSNVVRELTSGTLTRRTPKLAAVAVGQRAKGRIRRLRMLM
jgi:CelD/BcsL family acetyltransferase involved in cellulose biosynthesis